jgi:cytochrome c peroxidase
MVNAKINVLIAVALIISVSSCKKEETDIIDQQVNDSYQPNVPSNLPAFIDDVDNPLTKEGVKLGRMLFYDKRLSGNNQLSCASCHRQDLAFTDGLALNNIGLSGATLHRSAPALINMAWAKNGLFWDGGSTNLESQAFGPLTSADEMFQNLFELETELKAIPIYVKQFDLAFKDGIKSSNVAKALAQFQRTLISGNSLYDKYKRKENGTQLTAVELQGMQLVEQKCKSCHSGELFTDNNYHNNGIDSHFNDDSEGIYQGRFRVTFNPFDLGKFKTPSLRNIMLTAPYMHDGRFVNIDEVLTHYSSGVKASSTVDQLLYQNNGQLGIPLSSLEREAIKAFLNRLTDQEFITNKNISNPHL